jgi:hypothetical protein
VTIGKCPECKATVDWTRTANGNKIAINLLAVRVAMTISPKGSEEGEVIVLRQARTVHFDTCTKKPASQRTGQ